MQQYKKKYGTLDEIKKSVNLIEYARDRHGLACNSKGFAPCPFHGPDKTPSFQVYFDEIWKFNDHHPEGESGSIVDFEMLFSACSEKEAIKKLLDLFGSGHKEEAPPKKKTPLKPITYVYKDKTGKAILRKTKQPFSDGSKTFFWEHKAGRTWFPKKGEFSLIPYHLDEFKGRDNIVICEGEKDCDKIKSLGFTATTAPAGAGSWNDNLTPLFSSFFVITFLYDVGAENAAARHASRLKKAFPDTRLFVAKVPLPNKNQDISDWLDIKEKQNKDPKKEFQDLLKGAEELKEPKKEEETDLHAHVINMEDVKEEPIKWLLPGAIPLCMTSLLFGNAGLGKSFFSLYLASRISTGRHWVTSEKTEITGSTILVTTEDIARFTIKRRLRLMGADPKKVKQIDGAQLGITKDILSLTIDKNLNLIEKVVAKIGDVRLVVFDPITEFLGKVDDNRTGPTRQALAPLQLLAEKYQLSVLIISHMNKNDAVNVIFRATGSQSYFNTPRSVWILQEDPDDKGRRALQQLKNNLAPIHDPIGFSIFEDKGIQFDSLPVNFTPDALSREREDEPGALESATEFLTQLFRDENHIPSNEVYSQALEQDIKKSTLRTAKKILGICAEKQGLTNKRRWEWYK